MLVITIYVLNVKENKGEVNIDIFDSEDKNNAESSDKKSNDKNDNTDSGKVVVDIKGMVVNPGVYEVSSTARVNDVITLAGGLVDGADTSLINLAQIVSDEMTIIIYSNSEVLEKLKGDICVCDCPLINNDACIKSVDNTDLVNINTASVEEVMTIPGIGEVKAKEIIKYREDNGNYSSIEDIKNVDGIGETLFEKIKKYITV